MLSAQVDEELPPQPQLGSVCVSVCVGGAPGAYRANSEPQSCVPLEFTLCFQRVLLLSSYALAKQLFCGVLCAEGFSALPHGDIFWINDFKARTMQASHTISGSVYQQHSLTATECNLSDVTLI